MSNRRTSLSSSYDDTRLSIELEEAEAEVIGHTKLTVQEYKEKATKALAKDDDPDNIEAAEGWITEHVLSFKKLGKILGTKINLKNIEESKGLSPEEVNDKLSSNGYNELSVVSVTPAWLRFLRQFISLFPLLLEVGGILCLIAYILEVTSDKGAETNDNLYLGVVLLLVVIATAIFAFLQESKAKNASAGFSKMAPPNSVVVREGKQQIIPARELVPGDIVVIKAGDKVPADIIFLQTQDLKVNNSSITGESEPQTRIAKCTHPLFLESKNVGFFGTLVQEGKGIGVIIRTGDSTYIGQIAKTVRNAKPDPSPLKREVSRFIKIITVVALVIGAIFLIASFVVNRNDLETTWVTNIVFVIGIIVANVPEGLLPTVTVALTLTAKRLAKKKVLVKNLEAVETLGSCSTICSDKTGTLTQNIMTVVHCWYDGGIRSLDELITIGAVDYHDPTFKSVYLVGALCSNTVFDPDPENMELPIQKRVCIGDASETAILKFCEKFNPVEEFRENFPKVLDIPFNSENKWQLSVHQYKKKKCFYVVLKGAPERVAARCSFIEMDGVAHEFDSSSRAIFEKSYETLASNGERVLAMAYKVITWEELEDGKKTKFTPDSDFLQIGEFIFVGMVGLQDPPRQGVKEAVAECRTAGVRVIMVTGDHALTATAIAKEIGIIRNTTLNEKAKKKGFESWRDIDSDSAKAVVITGAEIPGLSDEEWDIILSKRQVVFARTSPEQKLQIVEHCQKRGEIVAVTGDGVNDSPALKKADLGCAMGIAGSEVSKDSAVVILMDDNFASIVVGVKEGRIIFDNLKKSIVYTLSSNSAELLPFIAYFILQMPLALSAILILCIDLGTDMIPAISLAYERAESDIMKKPPRNPKKDRLVGGILATYSYVWLGTWQAIAGFLGFFTVFWDEGLSASDILWTSFEYWKPGASQLNIGSLSFTEEEQIALLRSSQSSFFISVVVVRIACLLVCKTRSNSLTVSLRNKVLWIGVLFEICLAVGITNIPGVTDLFGTNTVGWKPWVIGIVFAISVIITEEIRKAFVRRKHLKWTYW